MKRKLFTVTDKIKSLSTYFLVSFKLVYFNCTTADCEEDSMAFI